ncbi:MAG: hypothetical protein L6427_12400 [Actinomycetia bacterium]|nr:hypothetical protein [Actinomycetes bacterium]
MQKPEELGYSDSDLADAWRKWEARVLDHWREDPLANAGERPWAWWQYEAPEPRLYFGDLPPDEREPRPSIYDVDYETEDEYLERLNLLEGWELEGVELHRDLYRGGREKVLEDRAAQARARMVVVED